MTTYKEYSFQDHKDVYVIIDSVMKSFGYKYYLIGANARDIQLYKAGKKPSRGTADIDFAVMIPTLTDYETFMKNIHDQGFKETKHKYRVIYVATNTVVDILPYGGIAQEYALKFDEINLELSVLGFEEVGDEKEDFKIDENFSIPTTPAHGLIILKLISWNDKKDRNKDLKDVRSLLDAGWELYEDEVYDSDSDHFDLLEDGNFDIHNAAARIMGRKIKPMLEKCEPLKKTILNLLTEEVNNPSQMTIEMSTKEDSGKVILLLSNLLQGIID
jgi:predicted nucleotidyltransferase